MQCKASGVFLLALLLPYYIHGSSIQAKNESSDPINVSKASTVLHFNSLYSFSRTTHRAFKKHLKSELQYKRCLRFHVAGMWWHYEWCLDQYVRQFHPSENSATEESILLGVYDTAKPHPMQFVSVKNLLNMTNPDQMDYMVQQRYENGDYCKEIDAHRVVYSQIKCCTFGGNDTYIYLVEEQALCEYNMTVCSPVACGLMQHDEFISKALTNMKEDERITLVKSVKDMFYHAYNGYMTHAFPHGDLQPLTCRGSEFELGRLPMLTLIDTLDTLAVLENATEFQRAVKLVVENVDYDLDIPVSVFETTIRVLGGLLSAHLFALNTDLKLFPEGEYDDALLRLAVDLADRLMPAFNTTTGIPYGTVNLRRGVPENETLIASTAGAGSLSVEFTMLSVLTGEPKYAAASRGAVRALFQRRSVFGLLGKHINTQSGQWTESTSGPGSNSDSFYEYLLKMYELFGDRESLEMFMQVYPSVLAHNRHGDWYADVSMHTGCLNGLTRIVFESLAAFWPGVQVAVGDLNGAAESMNSFYRVWRDYGFLPEQFAVRDWKPVKSRYPLRPELIESTLYMHEATNDSSWLRAGAHVVHSLQEYAKTSCGYASIGDIERKKQEDYMPSFFLSETCKYLYLLFNTTHFFRRGNYVLTTEAHPFPILPTKLVAPILRAADAQVSSNKVVYGNRFSPERVMRCEIPKFYDFIDYSVYYKGKFVERTSRCSPRLQSPVSVQQDIKPATEKIATTALHDTKSTTTEMEMRSWLRKESRTR